MIKYLHIIRRTHTHTGIPANMRTHTTNLWEVIVYIVSSKRVTGITYTLLLLTYSAPGLSALKENVWLSHKIVFFVKIIRRRII